MNFLTVRYLPALIAWLIRHPWFIVAWLLAGIILTALGYQPPASSR